MYWTKLISIKRGMHEILNDVKFDFMDFIEVVDEIPCSFDLDLSLVNVGTVDWFEIDGTNRPRGIWRRKYERRAQSIQYLT